MMRVSCLGGGVIGAGWAARFALAGHPVCLYDPNPNTRARMDETFARAERAWRMLHPYSEPATIRFAKTLQDACEDAEFVQESAPEDLNIKRALLNDADQTLPPEVPLVSSTSGLRPSVLQAALKHPQRLCVGHPFNPVYLLPLVEVAGGEKTNQQTLETVSEVYQNIGMHPLQVRHENDAFIADRLMEALWREALWLVRDDLATTGEIDDAIRYGCGLRWAFMGPFQTFRLAGGEGGIEHFLEQFGPALELPWTHLKAPPLDDELIKRIREQSDAQAAGRTSEEWFQLRDDCLVALLQALRPTGFAAGALPAWQPPHPPAEPDWRQPLRLHQARVPPAWLDYNGHMNESRYLQIASEATDQLLLQLGADMAYVEAGHSFYTVETHIRHLAEGKLGELLAVETQVVGGDAKRLHLYHKVLREKEALATCEQILLHVDKRVPKVVPAEGKVGEKIKQVLAAQGDLPTGEIALQLGKQK